MKSRFEVLAASVRQQWQLASVRNLVSGGVTGIAITLSNRVMMLLTAVILARLLGPDGYGIYAFAIAVMAVLSLGTEFGMYPLLVREVAVAHSKGDNPTVAGLRDNAFRFVLIASAIIGFVGVIVLWSTSLVEDVVERTALTLVLLALPANTTIRLSSAILAGLRMIARAQLVELFLLPAILLGAMLLIFASRIDANATMVMSVFVLCSMVALALALIILRAGVQKNAGNRVLANKITGLQSRSRPFLLMGAASVVTGQMDTVLVGMFLDNQSTALYRVAAQGATLIWFGIQILQSISSPYFARLYGAGDMSNVHRLFKWTTVLSVLSALPVIAIFILFGDRLIGLVFGQEYVAAHTLLTILCIGYAINIACGPIGSVLSMMGEEKFVSRVMIVSSVTNIVMALVLIQIFGAKGIAISTSFSVAFYHVALRLYGWRRFRL
ncbi:MAG TPA: oligosaccharide flippase family protein [Caulobacteraceae bacterium]|nr:oligosaccharide flippase family protein [Caulobacteraceae bacterium]